MPAQMVSAMPGPSPILLTGSTGQVGAALLPLLSDLGPVIAPTRDELDLSHPESIRPYLRALRPRWILNPAAYTAVDRAEAEPALAHAINADAVRVLGEEAHALGIPVVHLSTDYVFSGAGDQPWRETDPTGPLSVYGASKLAGEHALAATGAAHLILRTSWVYAATGQNFLRTMLRLGRERPVLRVVDDQFGTPTAAADLATLIVALLRRVEHTALERAVPAAHIVREQGGLVHAAGSGEPTTWCNFARAIFAHATAADPDATFATVEPIPTAAYPTPARRPANSRLNCDLLRDRFALELPDWQHSLARVIAETLAPLAAAPVSRRPNAANQAASPNPADPS